MKGRGLERSRVYKEQAEDAKAQPYEKRQSQGRPAPEARGHTHRETRRGLPPPRAGSACEARDDGETVSHVGESADECRWKNARREKKQRSFRLDRTKSDRMCEANAWARLAWPAWRHSRSDGGVKRASVM